MPTDTQSLEAALAEAKDRIRRVLMVLNAAVLQRDLGDMRRYVMAAVDELEGEA